MYLKNCISITVDTKHVNLFTLMINDEKQVNKDRPSLFNVQKLLFQDMESILDYF